MSPDDNRWMRDSAGNWIRDTALLRIGPETEIVATHISDAQHAELANIRAKGKTAAEQEITAQAHREAAGRAQVTREMAGYGAYPYRRAREAAQEFVDHTIPPGSRKPRPVRYARPVLAPDPKPVLTPEQEIRAELAAFDDWMRAGWDLPDWLQPDATVQEPGKCAGCHLGWAVKGGSLCASCQLRTRVTRANTEHASLAGRQERGSRDHSGWAGFTVLATALAAAAVAYSLPLLIIPAFALGLLAVLRRLR